MRTPFINQKLSRQVDGVVMACEMRIKELIKYSVMNLVPFQKLKHKVHKVIEKEFEQFPAELDKYKDMYQQAIRDSAWRWYNDFNKGIGALITAGISFSLIGGTRNQPPIKTLNTALKTLEKQVPKPLSYIEQVDGYKYHGYAQAKEYAWKVQKEIKRLGLSPTQILGDRKKSVLASVELDIRYEEHQKKLNSYIENGELIKRFSTHAGCSERCEKWQGKLVHLTAPAIKGFDTGMKFEGEKNYSFTAITNQVDKYGWKNNIYVGFNCRHELVDVDDKEIKYSKEQIEKERKINSKMREYERSIRNMKKVYKLSYDPKERKELKLKIRNKTAQYKEFAQSNNIAWYDWRIRA